MAARRNPLRNMMNSDKEWLICECIASERDRDILRKQVIDGWTYERIAEHFNLSTRRVAEILKAGKERILKEIPNESTSNTAS